MFSLTASALQVKQIMEEAVTRKFVHEDSSHIISFCGESLMLAWIGAFGAGCSLPGLCHVPFLGTSHSWERAPALGCWAGEMGSARGWIILAEVGVPEVFVLKIYRDMSKEGGVLAVCAAIEEGLEIIFHF